MDSASNFTVFWESLPDSDLLRIPGDDLQKYHQMIQAEKHSLSPVPRIFFLDGTVSSELLQSLRTGLGWAGLLLQGDGLLAPAAWRDASALSSSGLGCPCNNRIIKTKLKQQKNLILLLFHFVFNITCSAAGAGFRHFFSCSLLELLVPVWAGASNHRIPAKRQIIFQIELSENSVENARKTADFGIELSENFNR